MAQQIFKESDLRFTFNDDWVVKKYDDHAYFKRLAGYGLKGVDFIGIYAGEVYLIEVKNYHNRLYSPVAPDWSDLEGAKQPLVGIFKEKIEDSLKLIRVVYSSFEKRWWFVLSRKLNQLIGNRRLDKDWKFWNRVYELGFLQDKLNAVLWIELDKVFLAEREFDEEQFKKSLYTALTKENLEAKIHVLSLESGASNLFGMTVEFSSSKKNRY